MTLREARQLVSEGLGMTLQHRDGEYRVNFKGGLEATAYYTNDLQDALETANAMARAVKPVPNKVKTKEQRAQNAAHKRASRLRRKMAGLCQECDNPRYEHSKAFCLTHLLKHRLITRRLGGHEPRYRPTA